MDRPEDELLDRELSKQLSRTAGLQSVLFFGLGGLLASKLFDRAFKRPVEKYEVTVGVPLGATDVRKKTSGILKGMGKMLELGSQVKADSVTAIVDAGYIDTNPAIVHVQVTPISARSSEVLIRGIAKETPKQRSAQEAVEKLKAQLIGKA
jgi:hypothetical protein